MPAKKHLPEKASGPSRRVAARRAEQVYAALLQEYGQPVWRNPLPAIDELVSTILSQNTNDINRDRASKARSRLMSLVFCERMVLTNSSMAGSGLRQTGCPYSWSSAAYTCSARRAATRRLGPDAFSGRCFLAGISASYHWRACVRTGQTHRSA